MASAPLPQELGLLSTVAFFPCAFTHGKVYILSMLPDEITDGIKKQHTTLYVYDLMCIC